MKEYIEREAAIRAAKDGADAWDGGYSRYRDAYIESAINDIPAADVVDGETYRELLNALKPLVNCDNLLKKLERTQWISVEERLPEPRFAREWYLVALESGCVKTLAYENPTVKGALFRKGWHETASPVTHWMPLPEPPKEGEHDEH